MKLLDRLRRRGERVLPCAGCGEQPIITYTDPPANLTAHVTCVTGSRCTKPRWTSCVTTPRTREEAIREWNELNAGTPGRT